MMAPTCFRSRGDGLPGLADETFGCTDVRVVTAKAFGQFFELSAMVKRQYLKLRPIAFSPSGPMKLLKFLVFPQADGTLRGR